MMNTHCGSGTALVSGKYNNGFDQFLSLEDYKLNFPNCFHVKAHPKTITSINEQPSRAKGAQPPRAKGMCELAFRCCDKISDVETLREERFMLAHCFSPRLDGSIVLGL
jgi:hypothetical protein